MVMPDITKRVEKLRGDYMNCPMITKKLSYSKDLRQRLLFKRGWKLHPEVENTILRRAYADAYVIENMKPVITEGELIAGQPDFSPLTDDEKAELSEPINIPGVPGRTDHMSLDFEKLIKTGVNGMIKEIENKPDFSDNTFYLGAVAELKALLVLAGNYSRYARSLGGKEFNELADMLERVPSEPAHTFREALQSIHFYSFNLWGLYQAGRPDQYLLPYYRRDKEKGILTDSEAQELIDCFCLLYSTYITSCSSIGFMIGGRDRKGNAVENELTWMFLNSIPHTRTADPSIGLCVSSNTSKELLAAASKIISMGCTHPAFYNDKLITDSLISCGYDKEDARGYIHSCCVEITAAAKSSVWTVSPYHNILKMLLDVMRRYEDSKTLDELIGHFEAHLNAAVKAGNDNENNWQRIRSENGGEPLRVSCLVGDCIERGKSVNEGGAVYNNIQPNFLGIFNVVDSLAAIKELVFDSGELSLHELNEILDSNYDGYEALRERINNKLAHFGNDEPVTNELARRITAMIAESCKKHTTFRGSTLIPAAFSYNEHMRHGSQTPASPDGRLNGEPLCDGTNPVQGHDTKGSTFMLRSAVSWNHAPFLGGIAVNLELMKSQAAPDVIESLVKAYIDNGGMELQINVVDTSVLHDAKLHPEKHRNLVVRIGGYSDYYTSLSPQLQDEIIKRNRY